MEATGEVGDADPLLPLAGGEVRSPWTGQLKQRAPLIESLARWANASRSRQ